MENLTEFVTFFTGNRLINVSKKRFVNFFIGCGEYHKTTLILLG
jgi:hypothetical protein